MKREIYNYLNNWKKDDACKPLMLRGARQVGKTSAVRTFGKSYDAMVEVNFETQSLLSSLFERDLDPKQIIIDLQIALRQEIVPGKTLLFLDEIQACPRAMIALRYFYEQMPELHVIAAGSLLDFAIEEVGMPVGRVQFLHVYPMTLKEFLWAMGEDYLVEGILCHDPSRIFQPAIHEKAL